MSQPSNQLLLRLAGRDPRRILRVLARMELADVFGESAREGQAHLVIAARSGDRYAGWLAALYFRDGLYGFPQRPCSAEYWRARTERRLLHDLEFASDDEYPEMLETYLRWQALWSAKDVLSGSSARQVDEPTP